MIVDTSALMSIINQESDASQFTDALESADVARISAATLLEACIVADSYRDPVISRRLDELINATPIEIEAVTIEHVAIAREAYADFGRGSTQPAQLNFGDCFAYSLAYATREPLLFKGNDFTHTDIKSALAKD